VHGNALFFALGRQRNANRAAGSIDAVYQPSEAVFLPLFAFAGLLFRDVRLFMAMIDAATTNVPSLASLPRTRNAVARLDIRQLDRRGVFRSVCQARFARVS